MYAIRSYYARDYGDVERARKRERPDLVTEQLEHLGWRTDEGNAGGRALRRKRRVLGQKASYNFV